MGLEALIVTLVVGGVAGWLAGQIMKGRGFGLIGNIIVGIVGAVIGGWLLGNLGFFPGGLVGQLITALIGAVLLLFVIGLIKKA